MKKVSIKKLNLNVKNINDLDAEKIIGGSTYVLCYSRLRGMTCKAGCSDK